MAVIFLVRKQNSRCSSQSVVSPGAGSMFEGLAAFQLAPNMPLGSPGRYTERIGRRIVPRILLNMNAEMIS